MGMISYDIKHQKILVFQPSHSCEQHPRGYGRRANNWRSVILSNIQTIRLHVFELDDNSKGIDHIELQKMEDSSIFHFRTESKAKYTVNKVLRSRIWCFLSILNFGPRCPNEQHVGNFFKALYLSIALESGKVVLGNRPKCGASRFWA